MLEVNSVAQLNTAMPQLTQAMNEGFEVKVITTADMRTQPNQFSIWNSFGSLQKQFPGQIVVEWGNYSVCPQSSGQNGLTYADAIKWNFQKLGISTQNGAKWKIPSNELPLFQQKYPNAATIFELGPAVNQVTMEIASNTELQEAPVLGNLYTTAYPTVNVKITGNFDVANGPQMNALNELTVGPNSGKFQFVAGTGKITPATDSVHVANQIMLLKLNTVNALATTTVAGQKYWFNPNNGQLVQISGQFLYQIKLTNGSEVIFSLPAGKQAYNWESGSK